MKSNMIAAAIFVNALAYFPAYADTRDHPDKLEWDTLMLQLRSMDTALDTMSKQIEEMAKDMRAMKECSVLARQTPVTLAELRENVKPTNKAEDQKLIELFKQNFVARATCGLSPK